MSDAVLQRLDDVGLLSLDDGWSIARATGGLNTRVWYLSQGSTSHYVAREARPGWDLLAEARAISAAQGCAGVPRLRYVDALLLVHDYVPGETMPLENANEDQVVALARTLACLHRQRAAGYVVWPDRTLRLGRRIDALRARIASLHEISLDGQSDLVYLRDGFEAELDRLDDRAADWRSAEFAQIHGDLSIGNVLWDGANVNLIDWEYARAADPAEELAYLITEQPVTVAFMESLFDAYVDAGGDPTVVERLAAWATFTAVDSAIWWVMYLRGQGLRHAGHHEVESRIDAGAWWLKQMAS